MAAGRLSALPASKSCDQRSLNGSSGAKGPNGNDGHEAAVPYRAGRLDRAAHPQRSVKQAASTFTVQRIGPASYLASMCGWGRKER